MKIRIILFLAFAVIWSVIYHAVLNPVSTLVRQHVAVATINPSDSAYIAQQAIENGFPYGLIYMLVVLVIAVLCFYPFNAKKILN